MSISLETFLWAAITFLTGGMAAKLFLGGLASIYRWFFLFLVYSILRSGVMFLIPTWHPAYYYVYLATEGVSLVLYICMVQELYNLVLSQYRGIQTVSRWAISAGLAVSMVLSMVSLIPEMQAKAQWKALDYLFISERGVLSALVLLIVMMTLFLSWYPLSLPRNVVVHSFTFAAYFLSKAGAILYRNTQGENPGRIPSLLVMGIAGVCLVLWLLGMKPEGERGNLKVGVKWDPEREARLVEQLRVINTSLGRLGRE